MFLGEYDYEQVPGIGTARIPVLFRPGSTDKAAVITSEHGGPGEFEETLEEEGADNATIRSANKTTWAIANYKKNLKIPREFYMDDQHDSIARNVERLGARARTTQDKKAFDIYAYVDGRATWSVEFYKPIARHIQQVASNDFGIELEWGGDWKNFIDLPHFQIV